MATVSRRVAAFVDERIVISLTYDDVTGVISQVTATVQDAAISCLVTVRNETTFAAIGSAILRQGALEFAVPASTVLDLANPLFGPRLTGGRALCMQAP